MARRRRRRNARAEPSISSRVDTGQVLDDRFQQRFYTGYIEEANYIDSNIIHDDGVTHSYNNNGRIDKSRRRRLQKLYREQKRANTEALWYRINEEIEMLNNPSRKKCENQQAARRVSYFQAKGRGKKINKPRRKYKCRT